MALAFTAVKRFPSWKGGHRHGIVDVTLDGSYVGSGGWSITATNLTLKRIWDLQGPTTLIGSASSTAVVYNVDLYKSTDTTWKARMWLAAGASVGTEMAGSTADLASVAMRVHYWGG